MNLKVEKKIFSLIALLLFVSVKTFANDHYKVNTERLNVRRTIGASSAPFGYISYGDTVEVISKDNPYWYKIKIQDKEGYVRSKYLLQIKNEITTQNKYADFIIVFAAIFLVFSIVVCLIAAFTNGNKQIYNESNLLPGTTIIVKHKSVGVALLLTFLFGPFGMLYSTVLGAGTMLLLPIIITISLVEINHVNADYYTVGTYFFAGIFFYGTFYWFICIVWAAIAASRSNKIIINQSPLLKNDEN